MCALNIAGCPKGVRFVVLKMERLDFWHARVTVVHSYIGIIELQHFHSIGALENCRIFPRPLGGSENKYAWSEPLKGEMWNEALTVSELEEYLDA